MKNFNCFKFNVYWVLGCATVVTWQCFRGLFSTTSYVVRMVVLAILFFVNLGMLIKERQKKRDKKMGDLKTGGVIVGEKNAFEWFYKNTYECDPEKNTECTKEGCYINGGECSRTTKKEYAREV